MIKVIDLYKSFNDNNVLNGVNLTVETGDCIAIIGKSGSGKSVLLKHLLGLMQPDSGEVWIDNKIIHGLTFRELQKLRSKIGMVFQSGALFDSMTVSENIKLALERLTELNNDEVEEKIKASLEEIGMEGTENLMPSELSGGMKKRVGIARAIAFEPDYLFYDEPTTGLDPIMSDIINKLIVKFQAKKKITSVIVTHSMKTVYDVVDRVLMIHDGKIQFNGTPKEIKNSTNKTVSMFVQGKSAIV